MKSILFSFVLILSSAAMADGPECTQESRERWLKTDEMKSKAERLGYKIKKFMTLEKCYEITGELDGKKVVHLFNPVDGVIVIPPPTVSPAPAPAKK